MAYFKNVGQKISHNSTIPSLGIGNKDIRPLQDLITAEKAIVSCLVKLSTELTKATDCLKAWGHGEGDDLGDVLNGSHKLLARFASSISRYATHEQAIRDHMKSIRTREERLDELKQRRRKIAGQAEAADRKLNKMSPENKNLQAQTDMLMNFREQTRELDAEILSEEAALGDLKREVTKNWMTLKFGGLQELCESGLIVADYGKLIIAELPQDHVQPGQPRPYYLGHSQVEAYASDALADLSGIVFHGEPPLGRPGARIYQNGQPLAPGIESPGITQSSQQIGQPDELGMVSLQSERQAQTYGPSSNIREGSRNGQYSTMPSRLDTALSPLSPSLGNDAPDSSFSAEVERGLSAHRESMDNRPYEYSADLSRQEYAAPVGPPPGAAVPQLPDESAYGGHDPGYGPEDYSAGLAYMDERHQSHEPERTSVPAQRPREILRVPVPEMQPQPVESIDGHTDESALNAAVAREVAREMDQLSFNPPYQPPRLSIPEPQPPSAAPPSPFARRHDSIQPARTSNDSTTPAPPYTPYTPIPITTEPPPTAAPVPLPSSYFPSERQTQPPSPSSSLPRPASPPATASPSVPLPSAYPPRELVDSPYRSPTDSPVLTSNVSLSSVNRLVISPGPLPPAGVRTISAAAFRRQHRTVSDVASPTSPTLPLTDTSPLSLRKRPEQHSVPSTAPAGWGGVSAPSASPSPGQFPNPPPHIPAPPQSHEEESFDYISAYLGNNGTAEEGHKEDFR